LNRNGKLLCEIDRTCGVDGIDGNRVCRGREDPPEDCGAGGEYDGVGCKIASEYDGRIVSKDFMEMASSDKSLLVNSSCMPGLAWDIDREGEVGWRGGEVQHAGYLVRWLPACPVIKDIDSGCGWSNAPTALTIRLHYQKLKLRSHALNFKVCHVSIIFLQSFHGLKRFFFLFSRRT
jgi:hypothetical protein